MSGFISKEIRILTPQTLSTSWAIVPIDTSAQPQSLILQGRTAVDIYVSTAKSGNYIANYWSIKAGASLAVDIGATKYYGAGEYNNTTLVTNGNFTGNATGWTYDDAFWSYYSNAIQKDQDGTSKVLSQSINVSPLNLYIAVFTVSGFSTAGFTVSIGGGTGIPIAANGVYTLPLVAGSAGKALAFTSDASTAGSRFTLDSIAVYAVNSDVSDVLLAQASTGAPVLEMASIV